MFCSLSCNKKKSQGFNVDLYFRQLVSPFWVCPFVVSALMNTTSLLSTQLVCPEPFPSPYATLLGWWARQDQPMSELQSKANPLSSSNLAVSSLTLSVFSRSDTQHFCLCTSVWLPKDLNAPKQIQIYTQQEFRCNTCEFARCWTKFCATCCSSLLQSPTMNCLTVNLRNHNLRHTRQWKNNSDCCAWVCQYDRNLMKWEWT